MKILPLLSILALTLLPARAATPASQPAAQGGYLFVTFKGEATPKTEQIYFGISADGFKWDALNNADPVLVSDVGEKGVRDPYLLRSHDGKQFFIVATDLSINLNKDWTRATHAGSKSIVIWQSDDLVKWSAPRLVKVAPDDAGCTWAPEAIFDPATNDYMVYWSSTTQRDNFAKQRVWAAHTPDFKTFSKAEIYIEKPDTVYDADIIRAPGENGKFYRFTKNAKPNAVTMETADQLAGPWTDIPVNLTNTQGLEGPASFLLNPPSKNPPANFCLLLDAPNHGYKLFTTSDVATGKFTPSDVVKYPFTFRHGSVLPLSADELQRVKAACTPAVPVSPQKK